MDEKASTTIGFFCRARASMASPGSCGSSPTTGRTTAPRASSRTSRPWPHAIRGSAPTPQGTMARSSATTASWPRSASTPAPTPHSSSATTPSQPPPVGRRCAARSDSPSHRAHWSGPRQPAGRPRDGPGTRRRDRGRCARPQPRRRHRRPVRLPRYPHTARLLAERLAPRPGSRPVPYSSPIGMGVPMCASKQGVGE